MVCNKALITITLVLSLLVFSGTSWAAGLLFDAGASVTYEDNIFGSPAEADKDEDIYSTLSAAIGGYTETARPGIYLFAKAGADVFSYRKNTELNETAGFLNIGVYRQLTDALSAQVMARGKIKGFKEPERDSSAFGGAIELGQQVTGNLSLHEGYEYEKNNAESDDFTYGGHWAGLWSRYKVREGKFIGVGYSYFLRKFEDATRFKLKQHRLSANFSVEIMPKSYLNIGYDFLINTSNTFDTNYDNILSAGISYSY
jgi:hypothetical protein